MQERSDNIDKLASMGGNDDQGFLESMARCDCMVDHEDKCGMCEHQRIMAQVAREMLVTGGTIKGWSEETKKRWQATKYFELYQEEVAAKRDPQAAFDERGWEM